MAKAFYVLVRVVVIITCFDIAAWVCDRYWRTAGERAMRAVEKIVQKRTDTERSLSRASAAVNAYMRQSKKIPRKLTEVSGSENWKTDGWGKTMRLEKTAGGVRVISAGPDGEFETDDDVQGESINGAK